MADPRKPWWIPSHFLQQRDIHPSTSTTTWTFPPPAARHGTSKAKEAEIEELRRLANEAKAAATGRSGNGNDAVQLDDAEAVQVVVFGGSFPGMLGMGPGWGRPVQGGRSFFSLWDVRLLVGNIYIRWVFTNLAAFFCGKCWLMYTIPWNSMGTGNTPSKRSMFQASTLAYQSVSNYSLPRWVVKGVQMVNYIEAQWVSDKQRIFAIKQNWKVSRHSLVVKLQIFLYFHPENWGNDPIWLIFFRFSTTN